VLLVIYFPEMEGKW